MREESPLNMTPYPFETRLQSGRSSLGVVLRNAHTREKLNLFLTLESYVSYAGG
jgi:hypothetical protein